jgi:catechol 2,3-dioxygenase-like lactoylglutathione lyase family enzyme
MIKPTGIVQGHYECRSLQQTVPILEELLALVVVSRGDRTATLQHPNTDWLLIVHETPGASDKPHYHHYGVRVATDQEVDIAHVYLQARKQELGLKIIPPETRRIAHSVHFFEPGGNCWEIESYEGGAKKHGLSASVASPWKITYVDPRYPERGYAPQCLSHGTNSCEDIERARSFYRRILGLDVTHPYDANNPYYVKHAAQPWYVVCLRTPLKNRMPSGANERFTLALESDAAVLDAHRWLSDHASEFGIDKPQPIGNMAGSASFIFTDTESNCWELMNPTDRG